MEVPSREQVPQLFEAGFASEAAETVDSPWAARVGFSRPSKTGPWLEKADGVLAAAPWPTEPALIRFLALAGVPTETGGAQNCPPFPAEGTRSRAGEGHIARSAARANES